MDATSHHGQPKEKGVWVEILIGAAVQQERKAAEAHKESPMPNIIG